MRRARKAYRYLLDAVPEQGRDPLFTVCVEDREINSLLHSDLPALLRCSPGILVSLPALATRPFARCAMTAASMRRARRLGPSGDGGAAELMMVPNNKYCYSSTL